jgi:hypothetical protein
MRDRADRPEKPASGTPGESNIGPAGEITALAVGYGHLVPADTVLVERRVPTSRGMLGYESLWPDPRPGAAGPETYASFLGPDGGDAGCRHAHGTVAALGKELRVRGTSLRE